MKKHMGIGLGAALIALSVAGGLEAAALNQDTSTAQAPRQGRWQGRGGPGRFGGGPMGPLGLNLRQLDLTDSQREQVRSIIESSRDQMTALRERVVKARLSLGAAVAGDVFDEGTIRARSADLAAAEVEVAVARGRVHAEVFQILTPDQQAKAKAEQARVRERIGRRGAQRPRPGA